MRIDLLLITITAVIFRFVLSRYWRKDTSLSEDVKNKIKRKDMVFFISSLFFILCIFFNQLRLLFLVLSGILVYYGVFKYNEPAYYFGWKKINAAESKKYKLFTVIIALMLLLIAFTLV